ncbi:flagellar hook assembly protein FlgD [Bosea caraganae]|uniref:Basal-body rod modification protein FlgD n=1 Tax=Bosea caraganae TaxID=2763117 RepID=A0A370L7T9_9HYPH|nr:flagellar hook capping FlgD N-terminal domain-containing protein [Bosea caraganae]RDJ25388.1 flagellar hook assembly protein FlgD [Bosea caraganae]RDJ25827.1 flagellar hook assembly protein FlgD [Bosea caraganae]
MTITNGPGAVTNNSGSAAGSAANSSSIAGNFDQFLTLLTTQLKNQSPLDPLDTNQFTEQLVQFAGVEQQLKTNETLSTLLSINMATTATNAVAYIGSTITADGASSQLKNGKAEWSVNAAKGGTATITIKDAKGSVVRTMTQNLVAGDQKFVWDGKTSIGGDAAPGEYQLTVDAVDVNGQPVTTKTQIKGMVDGVDFNGLIPVLKIGDISVPIDKVKSVVRSEGT